MGADVADREGYTIFVGGNVGRHPRIAYKLLNFADEEAVFHVIENSIKLFEAEGERGERFGHLIGRLGLGEAIRILLPDHDTLISNTRPQGCRIERALKREQAVSSTLK